MSQQTPMVRGQWVEDPAVPDAIRLDTPAWFAWLEAPDTSRFAYPVYDPQQGYITGVLTVRKERRQRGGMYWSVFRRVGSCVHKHYLGRSHTVTQARLQTLVDQLLTRATHDQTRTKDNR